MSDIEGIAYVQAKWSKVRGLISGKTYDKVSNILNMVRGENESLKTQVGRLTSELEDCNTKCNNLQSEVSMLRDELAQLSAVKVDEKIEDIAPEAIPTIVAIESGEATI